MKPCPHSGAAWCRPSGTRPVVADAEKIFASALASTLEARLTSRGALTRGARTWARAMVGSITLAVDEWITAPDAGPQAMADELTMFVWGGVVAIVTEASAP